MAVLNLSLAKKMKRWSPHNINRAWDHLDKCGRFTDFKKRHGPFNNIKDEWKNNPAYVVGGSPAARGFDLNLLDNLNSIGCNHMIETYENFKWFIFMDHRFIRISTYDLTKFKGKIFAHNSAPVLSSGYKNMVYFRTKHVNAKPTLNINDGLFARSLTGLCALHLAIISGADPIYMIGMDNPKDWDISQGIHATTDYTGEAKDRQKSMDGYIRINQYYEAFKPWSNRIINVCPNGRIDTFKKMSLEDLTTKLKG